MNSALFVDRPARPAPATLPLPPADEAAFGALMQHVGSLRSRARLLARTRPCLDAAALGARHVGPHLLSVERRYASMCRHGSVRLERLSALRHDESGLLGLRQRIDPARLLLLDCHDAHIPRRQSGAPLIISLARLEGETLHLRQYIATRASANAALLELIEGFLRRASHLVVRHRAQAAPLQHRAVGDGDPTLLDLHTVLRRAQRVELDGVALPEAQLPAAERELLQFHRPKRPRIDWARRDPTTSLTQADQAALQAALSDSRFNLLSLAALLPVLAALRQPGLC